MEFVKSKIGKRILCLFFVVLAIAAVLIAVLLSRNKDGYRTIKVSEVSGKVGVVTNGIEYEAYPGMILKEGYVVVTDSNSYVRMVLDGDKYIKVEEGSRVAFQTLGVLGSGKTTIQLERGTITSEIVKPLGEDENYIINTPNAVLAVRGTFFKVGLTVSENGETTTNVQTYGGIVASSRIQPDGKQIEEEVLIDAGYRTTVKMDKEDTIYVVEQPDGQKEHTEPIVKTDISDEDLVDIYFASKNGHEMFLPPEDIEKELKDREIDIKEKTSVYEQIESLEKSNTITSPDDGEPVVKEENTETSGQVQGAPSDGGHKHLQTESIVEATCTTEGKITISCSLCGEVLSETKLPATGHTTIVNVGTDSTHTACADCGMLISGIHSFTDAVTKEATCVENGITTHSCTCGYSYTTEIVATGHIHEVDGGTQNSHIECSDCGTVLSSVHSYTDTQTKTPTCTDEGELVHACACGYSYTE